MFILCCNQLQVEKIIFRDLELGSDASKNCSVAVLSMNTLHSLEFHNVNLDSQFFTVLIDMQHDSQVKHFDSDQPSSCT